MSKILVVDDDGIFGEMLQYILRHEGHDVSYLKKPKLAFEHIIKWGTELVLLDKLMDTVDGSEICRQIKADERTQDVPVLMMSGLKESEEKCIRAGADDFLSKPFERDELMQKIQKLFSQKCNKNNP